MITLICNKWVFTQTPVGSHTKTKWPKLMIDKTNKTYKT